MDLTITILTGAVLAFSMWRAYRKYHDPLHPLMFLGPICIYVYVYQPLMLQRVEISYYFPEKGSLEMAQTVILAFMAALCYGLLNIKAAPDQIRGVTGKSFQPGVRSKQRFRIAALILGSIGLGGFIYMSATGPGVLKAYGQYKGALVAVSGYIGESTLLTIPACILYIFSRQGEKWNLRHYALLALFALPHLIHAFLGARRGPAFSIMVALLIPWFMTMSRRPSLRAVLTALLLIGIVIIFLFSQRSQIYIGSEFEFDKERFVEKLKPTEDAVNQGNDYIYGCGLMIASKFHNHHFWGRRYAVLMLVRPIPRQIWPKKYSDTGMSFLVEEGSTAGMTDSQWMDAVGWFAYRGSAPGIVGDLFLEFGWFGLVGAYLLGLGFAWLWKNALIRKGLWGVLYSLAGLLSIYLPAQSVTAFLYRFVFMSIPCILVWRYLIQSTELVQIPRE